ncbi:hypothetical protein pb186bvf_009062 [Paramecium bursaria]
MSFNCQKHNQEYTQYCQDPKCKQLLCFNCDHAHQSISIQQLMGNQIIDDIKNKFQTFRDNLIKKLDSMEVELDLKLNGLSKFKIPTTQEELEQVLQQRLLIRNNLISLMVTKLKLLSEALTMQQTTQNSEKQKQVQICEPEKKSKNEIPQKESVIKSRKSMINDQVFNIRLKGESVPKIEETVEVRRLKEFYKGPEPWIFLDREVYVTIFKPLRALQIIGIYQPTLISGSSRKTLGWAVHKKRNLLKKPIYMDKRTLNLHKEPVIDNCYRIMFHEPVSVEKGREYSLVLYAYQEMRSNYFSVPAPANEYLQFLNEDLHDDKTIIKSKEIDRVYSSYRSGMFPTVIIRFQQEEEKV